ncbi:hypothetical protein [Streptomyces sp. NPDC049590]|uniref:hypothetical protein n=1 Tax=Streptomyces sp. NPDC049590 TaxID=3154834 RepID=UPI00342CA4FE
MPTLVDAAGPVVAEGLHGRSSLPLLHGGPDPQRPRPVLVRISEDQIGRPLRADS